MKNTNIDKTVFELQIGMMILVLMLYFFYNIWTNLDLPWRVINSPLLLWVISTKDIYLTLWIWMFIIYSITYLLISIADYIKNEGAR